MSPATAIRVTAALPLAVLALVGVGCGGDRSPADAAEAAPTSTSAAVAAVAVAAAPGVAIPWEDPEPPDAQARAIEAVGGDWNADKTTRLAMSITTLVDRTSGLAGFASEVAAAETSLDERLARLGAEVTETEVTIRLPGSILFDFDSAAIRADAERTLAEVASVLAAYGDRPIRVEGHTDAIASEGYNQTLSERRAESVRAWLAAHGVAVARISVQGHGESRPVADNATAAGRQKNRRVEIIAARG